MQIKILIISILISASSSAQNYIQKQWEFANSVFEKEDYFDAVTEFKRLMFFDSTETYKFDCLLKIGQSYKYGGYFENAIKYFSLADLKADSPEKKFTVKIEIVRTNILRRTTEKAFRLLDELEKADTSGRRREEIIYWRGWAYMFADDWENAQIEFGKLAKDHPLKKLSKKVEDEKYSVIFANVISFIIPGAGQIYTGHYLSGIMSLGWNVLWGYLTINAFLADRAFDGIAIGSLLWLRFYRGNLQNAESFAIDENIKIANDAYRYLKNNYQGIKP